MGLFHSIISGLIQGLTEFLPVSSSGHLAILHNIFGYIKPQLFFDVCLHAGSALAILIVLRKEIKEVLQNNRKWIFYILISCFITFPLALFVKKTIIDPFYSKELVAIGLLLTAFILVVADFKMKKNDFLKIPPKPLRYLDVIVIGFIQGLAVIPGLSRSGATVATAIILNKDLDTAFNFSFMLAVPTIAAASVYELFDLKVVNGGINLSTTLIGFLVSFFTSIVALMLFRRALRTKKLFYFSIYCLFISLFVFIKK